MESKMETAKFLDLRIGCMGLRVLTYRVLVGHGKGIRNNPILWVMI